MTKFAADHFEQSMRARTELKDLEEALSFLKDSLALYIDYYLKTNAKHVKSILHGDIVLEERIQSHKLAFYNYFLESKSISSDSYLIKPKVNTPGLKAKLEKDLKGFESGIIDDFLLQMTIAEKYIIPEFSFELLYLFYDALNQGKIDEIKNACYLIAPYYRYIVKIVSMILNNVPISEINNYFFETYYSSCSGYLVNPIKKFIDFCADTENIVSKKQFIEGLEKN